MGAVVVVVIDSCHSQGHAVSGTIYTMRHQISHPKFMHNFLTDRLNNTLELTRSRWQTDWESLRLGMHILMYA